MDRITVRDIDLNRDEIESRKQRIRDLWEGKPLDRAPIHLLIADETPQYSVREQFQNTDKQLAESLRIVKNSWELIPDGDFIPAMRPDIGCSGLATAFGAELFWGDDPDQTCGVKAPVLSSWDEVDNLEVPSPTDGWMQEGTDRVRVFAEAGEGLISVSLLDMAGGLNVVNDLVGGSELYMGMYDNPEALDCLLDKVQQLFLAAMETQIEAAGGQENITTTDFPDFWYPEGHKGHVSDDISANISPELFRRFSIPSHSRVFQRYGGGGLHNCGPNPCAEQYLECDPAPRAIDLSYLYSREDLPRLKELYKKRAYLYFLDFPESPQECIDAYRDIMERMAPDLLVVPYIFTHTGFDVVAMHRELREISVEYARRMDWGWA